MTNDSQTPLHLLQPAYTIPYGELSVSTVKSKTDLILKYLQASTLTEVENSQTHVRITDFSTIDENSQLVRGGFRLASYEWGVTYAAMVRASEATGDTAYLQYAVERMKFLAKGEVEGTCVGTGMGFDPAFYYFRPVSNAAAHGYGPALLAGAEMIQMLKTQFPKINDSAIQFYPTQQKTTQPIFSVE